MYRFLFIVMVLFLAWNKTTWAANESNKIHALVANDSVDFAKTWCKGLKNQVCDLQTFEDENLLLSEFLFDKNSMAILNRKIDRVFIVPYKKLHFAAPKCYFNPHQSNRFFVYVNKKNPIKYLNIETFDKIFYKNNKGGDFIFWNGLSNNKNLTSAKINKIVATKNNDFHLLFEDKEYANEVAIFSEPQVSATLEQDPTAIALVDFPIKSQSIKQIEVVGEGHAALLAADYIYINSNSNMNTILAQTLSDCGE